MQNFSKTLTRFSFALATSLMLISCGGSDSGSSANNGETSANQPIEVKKPKIMYVCADGKADANGSSWDTCTAKIQDAIKQAQDNGKDLWFKAGTYVLTQTISIENKDIKLYGGFKGTEKDLKERKFENATILSGDNKIRVLKTENLSNKSVLDGFEITKGRLTGSGRHGIGMLNANSHITITNTIFSKNIAPGSGGAMNNFNSNPRLTNVSFVENTSDGNFGGAISNYQSNPTIINASFDKNKAYKHGGAIYNIQSHPKIINTTFSKNKALQGSAIFNNNSNPTITNVTFSQNVSPSGASAISNANSNPTIKNSIFWSNTSEIGNDDSSKPVITNSIIKDEDLNAEPYKNKQNSQADPLLSQVQTKIINGVSHVYYDLGSTSPAINKGDNTANTQSTDQIGNNRKNATIDIGAIEMKNETAF